MLIQLVFGFNLHCQTVSPSVSPTIGGFANGGDIRISWTIGETPVPTLNAGNNELSEGFEQPEIDIITGTITGSPFCGGSTIYIPFTADGYVDTTNVYAAQLSDTNGSFANPVTLGTLTSTAISGTIVGTIPLDSNSATGYLVRVVGSAPAYNGKTSPTTITIYATPTITVSPSRQTICSGTGMGIDLNTNVENPIYIWSVQTDVSISNASSCSSSCGATISQTLSNGSYNTIGTAIYTITATTANNCSATAAGEVMVLPAISVAAKLDNCSCLNGTDYDNVISVYAGGGSGGYMFSPSTLGDILTTTIDSNDVPYSGSQNHSGTKGIFWSKADGGTHLYTITDAGYGCTATVSEVTQNGIPTLIPFGTTTGVPVAIPSGGGGNGLSGSINNVSFNEPATSIPLSNVINPALICHQTADFGNNWVVYQVNGGSNNNYAVAEINDNSQNLDSVQVSVYRDPNLPEVNNSALNTTACYLYPQYALERHFVINSQKSSGANSFNNNVGVRLYFSDAELQDLIYWTTTTAANATGPSAGCAQNDVVNSSTYTTDLYVTKYTSDPLSANTTEDGLYNNDLPTGLYRVFGANTTASLGNGPLTVDGGQATLTTGGTTGRHYVELNVREFSEFWLSGSQSIEALPVEMIYLEAEAVNNDSIQVRWATASEINNREFDVERSTDGTNWTTIGIVPGHDNSTVTQAYIYNDLSVVPGIVYYYRLKQIDNNGNYQYTDIVQAMLTGTGAFEVLSFVPNPTSGNTQLTIVTTQKQEITVEFYDMLGQKVMSNPEQLTAGSNRLNFDLHRFAAGTYSAVVTTESQLYTRKLVITGK